MTDLIVTPSKIGGALSIPSSKSHSIRAILFAALAKGTSHIYQKLDSPDIHQAIQAARMFGANIQEAGDDLAITGTGGRFDAPQEAIDVGNSGQVLRFVGAFSVLSSSSTILCGDHSIETNRPVKPLLEALNQLGAKAVSIKNNGYAPIQIQGPVTAGKVTMDGKDSQPVSGILMLSAFLPGMTTIEVQNPGEKPWIDLTLAWLKRLGVRYENHQYESYKVWGKESVEAFNYHVPADFSSAAFPAAAALIAHSKVELSTIDMHDSQGDKEFFQTLQSMGAEVAFNEEKMTLTVCMKEPRLIGKSFDINNYIDAITLLAVLGCYASTPLEIVNAEIARAKECDRISSICTELKKMGAQIEETKAGFITHPSCLKGAKLKSYHDHRMAMSLTVAALNAEGESIIEGIDCIAKSYPSFVDDFIKLGAKLKVV